MQISGIFHSGRGDQARSLRSGDVLRLVVRDAGLKRGESADAQVSLQGKGVRILTTAAPGLIPGARVTVQILSLKPSLQLRVLADDPPTTAGASASQFALLRGGGESSRGEDLKALLEQVFALSRRAPDSRTAHHALALYRQFFGDPGKAERRHRRLARLRSVLELADRGVDDPDRSRDSDHRRALGRRRTLGHPPRREHFADSGRRYTPDDSRRSEQLTNPDQRGDTKNTAPPDDMLRLLQWLQGETASVGPSLRSDSSRDRAASHRETSRTARAGIAAHLTRATKTPDHPLQLFNSLPPRSGDVHWVVIPIRGSDASETRTLEAVLKVGWHIGLHRAVEAVLSVSPGAEDSWWFRWSLKDGTDQGSSGTSACLDRVASCGKNENSTALDELLARLGFTGHTGVEKNDGFSLDTGSARSADSGPGETSFGVDVYG